MWHKKITNTSDVIVYDKVENICIRVRICGQERLQTVATEKKRKFEVLADNLGGDAR